MEVADIFSTVLKTVGAASTALELNLQPTIMASISSKPGISPSVDSPKTKAIGVRGTPVTKKYEDKPIRVHHTPFRVRVQRAIADDYRAKVEESSPNREEHRDEENISPLKDVTIHVGNLDDRNLQMKVDSAKLALEAQRRMTGKVPRRVFLRSESKKQMKIEEIQEVFQEEIPEENSEILRLRRRIQDLEKQLGEKDALIVKFQKSHDVELAEKEGMIAQVEADFKQQLVQIRKTHETRMGTIRAQVEAYNAELDIKEEELRRAGIEHKRMQEKISSLEHQLSSTNEQKELGRRSSTKGPELPDIQHQYKDTESTKAKMLPVKDEDKDIGCTACSIM